MGEKRYYWLKLRNDFFDSVRMKKLRGVAGGDTYTIIYLKLQLAALETEGTLIYEGVENSLAEELALLINEKPEDVGLTLNFLQSVGLCEVSKDGTLCTLPEVLMNTGSEASSAQRVRNLRKRQTLQCNADVTEVKRVCNVEKDIEKEKDIEIEKEEKKAPRAPSKHIHGEHGKVRLTDDELNKLKSEYSNSDELIQYLDEYKAMTGKVYKSDYLAIKKWVVNAVDERKRKNIRQSQTPRRVAEMPAYMTEQPRPVTDADRIEQLKLMYPTQVAFGQVELANETKAEYKKLTGRDIEQDVEMIGEIL